MSALPADLDVAPVDPGYGEDYGCGRAAYVTPEGIAVWMWRKGVRVRFYDARGAQHGPQHDNVVPACIWAAANGWIDPYDVNLSIACILEVRKQLAEQASGQRQDKNLLSELKAGAFDPRSLR